jgi:hypothetical protein
MNDFLIALKLFTRAIPFFTILMVMMLNKDVGFEFTVTAFILAWAVEPIFKYILESWIEEPNDETSVATGDDSSTTAK